MKRIAVVFDNFGPYHLARLQAASRVCNLLAVEVTEHSNDYDWTHSRGGHGFQSITLDNAKGPRSSNLVRRIVRLRRVLSEFGPDCVFLPGWSRPYSLGALAWCRTRSVPAVIMSESTRQDAPRHAWKEWLKTRILAKFSAALVGGSRHTDYLLRLGMVPEQIFEGYDVVDNDYFQKAAEAVQARDEELRTKLGLPQHYFLASARFIKKKNLLGLIEAYAEYRRRFASAHLGAKETSSNKPWSLVLLGDGPERKALQQLISAHRLEAFVFLPGFKQYPDLPFYYGLADVFVHASTSEPWGLVVNEAMASGLPLLVSDRCGCVPDLIQPARNGFIFDPANVEHLAQLMLHISGLGSERLSMCQVSRQIISRWNPERFACGLQAAAAVAVQLIGRQSRLARLVSRLGLSR